MKETMLGFDNKSLFLMGIKLVELICFCTKLIYTKINVYRYFLFVYICLYIQVFVYIYRKSFLNRIKFQIFHKLKSTWEFSLRHFYDCPNEIELFLIEAKSHKVNKSFQINNKRSTEYMLLGINAKDILHYEIFHFVFIWEYIQILKLDLNFFA